MKKFLSILLATLMCICCLGLVGCGGTGVYKFSSLTNEDGNTFEVGEKYNFITLDEDYSIIELKDDGVCVITSLGVPVEGTYEKGLFKVTMKIGNQVIEANLFFGKLTIKGENGAKTVYKK